MADSPPPRSTRLVRAVEKGRASSQPRERSMAAAPTASSGKTLQRAVKFPKPSNALRRYVAVARDQADPVPAVRLRTGPPAPAPRLVTAAVMRAGPARSFAGDRSPPAARPETDALTPIRTLGRLGDMVRRARRLQGLTQAGLAHAAGTGRRFISDVEAGKPTVEFERLMKLCRALGIRLFAAGPDDDD